MFAPLYLCVSVCMPLCLFVSVDCSNGCVYLHGGRVCACVCVFGYLRRTEEDR